MKKTLLLSVVASTMIMAGGDIAPVEPAVETPAPAVSGWEFSGQAALYYQTHDAFGYSDLFDQDSSAANAGLQLRAVNSDLYNGIGAGVEVSGLATFDLENSVVSDVMQGFGTDDLDGGWISQMYLTYGFDNTSFKLGRQELPKALSPFAFSEEWNVFKNTYDALLVVNTDISDTTLVGAWVRSANQNGYGLGAMNEFNPSFNFQAGMSPLLGAFASDMNSFEEINGDHGVFMLTAQNKSIENLTLTGSWYYSSEFLTNDDLNILWGDAQYNFMQNYTLGLQGGTVMHDAFETFNSGDDTMAFGAMIGGKYDMFHGAIAFSSVDDGGFGVFNVGGQQTALYTQMMLNERAIGFDSDTFMVKVGADVLGGKVCAAYGMSDMGMGDYNEFDLSYSAKVTDSIDLTVAYAFMDADVTMVDDTEEEPVLVPFDESNNVIRVIGRYNF